MPPSEARAEPVPLACSRFGSGPALVFLHGLFGSGRNWRGFARAFQDRFTCLLPDLRAHGASPAVAPVDYEAMAADVLALLDREGFRRASLIGHSMGGKVAMVVALTAAERVERLAVLDIAPVKYAHRHEALFAALRALDLTSIRRRADADRMLAASIADPGLRGFLLKNLVLEEGRARWRIDLALLQRAMPVLAGFPDSLCARRFEGPALFLGGTRSDYLREEHVAKIYRLFPAARIARVAGAGHWLHVERPAQVLALLEAFVAQ